MFFRSRGGPEPPSLFRWGRKLGVSDFLTRLLWRRGITSLEEMEVFLYPNLRHLSPLNSVNSLMEAAHFIARALEAGKRLSIWGDYDVDGVTSCAILFDFLRKRLDYEGNIYIPHRIEEGYGLSVEGVERLKEEGVDLLITVDCGITDVESISRAKELGMDVVVTDHHLPGPELPPADFIVNPKLGSSGYKNLAGVGVSFLLCGALNKLLPGEPLDIRQYLDLLALGTIADVVFLDIDNRILVKNGLLILSESTRPGIVALKEVSGISQGTPLGIEEVGYVLAPRINAAGRISHAQEALRLLLSRDIEEAREIARQLELYNRERRRQEDLIWEEALSQAREQVSQKRWGLVLFSHNWHQGVIGIVASRIAEMFYRPTFLLTGEDSLLKGSGRSIPPVHLYRVLERCGSLLTRFGGHAQAGGISMEKGMLEEFSSMFSRAVEEEVEGKMPVPLLEIEAKMPLSMVNYDLIKELQLLEPYGPGNPEPIFCSNPLRVGVIRPFGEGHLSLELSDPQAKRSIWGKVWRRGEEIGKGLKGREIIVAFYPRLSSFNGLLSIELHVKDLKSPGLSNSN